MRFAGCWPPLVQQSSWARSTAPATLPSSSKASLNNRLYTGSSGAGQSIVRYSAANPQDYRAIQVPALSLAALSDTLQTTFPWMADDRIPEQERDDAQACTTDVIVPEQRATFDAVTAANPAIEAQLWEQSHYLDLQQSDRTVAAVQQWLESQNW